MKTLTSVLVLCAIGLASAVFAGNKNDRLCQETHCRAARKANCFAAGYCVFCEEMVDGNFCERKIGSDCPESPRGTATIDRGDLMSGNCNNPGTNQSSCEGSGVDGDYCGMKPCPNPV